MGSCTNILEKIIQNKGKVFCCCLVTKSCLTLVTLWTVTSQAPLPVKFSRLKYWSGYFLLRKMFSTQGLNSHLLCLLRWFFITTTRETLRQDIHKLTRPNWELSPISNYIHCTWHYEFCLIWYSLPIFNKYRQLCGIQWCLLNECELLQITF